MHDPIQPVIRASGEPAFSSNPGQLTAASDLVYYLANDPDGSGALWRSDGTAEGTFRLSSFIHGLEDLYTPDLTAVGGRVFFRALSGQQNALWTSDGTPQGTVPLKTIAARGLVGFGGALYFSGLDTAGNGGLWRSDGTAAGTVLVRPMGPTPSDERPVVLGGRFFFVGDSSTDGQELWVSDGTATGTVEVKNIAPRGASSGPKELQAIGGRLFFSADDGTHGRELWVSDGTATGTRMVKDINPNTPGPFDIYDLTAADGQLFFAAMNSTTSTIWRSDGSANGTLKLASFPRPSPNDVPDFELTAAASSAYFKVQSSGGPDQIWHSDGTARGTSLVISFGGPTGVQGLTSFLGLLFFANADGYGGANLWRSDGTTAGTMAINHFDLAFSGLGFYNPILPIAADTRLFFAANDSIHGVELWASRGTSQSTALVKDVEGSQVSSYPGQPVTLGSRLFFGFYEPLTGYELWTSDGTSQGTRIVRDINPGPDSTPPQNLVVFRDKVFFSADDGGDHELWFSDGSDMGTGVLTSFDQDKAPSNLIVAGAKLFFTTQLSDSQSLWASDGTSQGTVKIKTFAQDVTISALNAAGGKLFISTHSSTTNPGSFELWASNGTALGTVSLGDRFLTGAAEGPGGSAILALNDEATGTELWQSDGTAQGTILIKDINPGTADSSPRSLATAGGSVYFAADDGVHGRELWKSDGTAQGTVLIKNIQPDDLGEGALANYPFDACSYYTPEIVSMGASVFFSAADGVQGVELWTSDGSEQGTRLVRDINPNPSSFGSTFDGSHPTHLTAVSDTLALIADDGIHGFELWASDGTSRGTRLVEDFAPGLTSGMSRISRPPRGPCGYTIFTPLLAAQDDLYLNGGDARAHGLWKVSGGSDNYVELGATGAVPGGVAVLPIGYGNTRLGGGTMTVTATLDPGLTYLGDTSGVTPTLVTSTTISWELTAAGANAFELLLQTPADAVLGAHLPVTLSLTTAADEDPANNTASGVILIARQQFVPLIASVQPSAFSVQLAVAETKQYTASDATSIAERAG